MKKVFVFTLLAAMLAGCSVDPAGEKLEGKAAVKTNPADMVKLYYAKIKGTYDHMGAYAVTKGFIEIADVAYDKEVAVAYSINDNNNWVSSQAHFVKDYYGKEVWQFDIALPYLNNEAKMQFAISYKVNGQTYWDNNNGQDYTLILNNGPTEYKDIVFGKSQFVVNHGESYIYRDQAYQSVFFGWVRANAHIGTINSIDMVYTTDGWNTTLSAPLTNFGHSTNPDVEVWRYFVNVDHNTTQIDCAFSMNVNGYVTWDNNFLDNYHVYIPVPNIQGYMEW